MSTAQLKAVAAYEIVASSTINFCPDPDSFHCKSKPLRNRPLLFLWLSNDCFLRAVKVVRLRHCFGLAPKVENGSDNIKAIAVRAVSILESLFVANLSESAFWRDFIFITTEQLTIIRGKRRACV